MKTATYLSRVLFQPHTAQCQRFQGSCCQSLAIHQLQEAPPSVCAHLATCRRTLYLMWTNQGRLQSTSATSALACLACYELVANMCTTCRSIFSGSDTDSVGDAQVPSVGDSPPAGDSNLLDSVLLAEWEDRAEQGLFRYDVTACPTQLVPGAYGFIAQCNEGRASKKRPTEFRVDQVCVCFFTQDASMLACCSSACIVAKAINAFLHHARKALGCTDMAVELEAYLQKSCCRCNPPLFCL